MNQPEFNADHLPGWIKANDRQLKALLDEIMHAMGKSNDIYYTKKTVFAWNPPESLVAIHTYGLDTEFCVTDFDGRVRFVGSYEEMIAWYREIHESKIEEIISYFCRYSNIDIDSVINKKEEKWFPSGWDYLGIRSSRKMEKLAKKHFPSNSDVINSVSAIATDFIGKVLFHVNGSKDRFICINFNFLVNSPSELIYEGTFRGFIEFSNLNFKRGTR